MISRLFKTLVWWALVAAVIIFFLQGNTIDSPAALWDWVAESATEVRNFFDDTFGQIDLSGFNINGEEIDAPKESE